jgi:hypothetical protein
VKESKGDKIPRGALKRAVVVETKYPTRRPSGATIQYLRNSAVRSAVYSGMVDGAVRWWGGKVEVYGVGGWAGSTTNGAERFESG